MKSDYISHAHTVHSRVHYLVYSTLLQQGVIKKKKNEYILSSLVSLDFVRLIVQALLVQEAAK